MKDILAVALMLTVVLTIGCYTQSLEERIFPAEPEVTAGKTREEPEARKETSEKESPPAPEEEPEELWWPC